MNMKRFLLLLCLFASVLSFSQGPVVNLDVTLKDDDTGKKLAGAKIEILQDGKAFTSGTAASNGRVPIIDLPIGHTYTIYIKKDGYVTKMTKVDAYYDYPEDLEPFIPLPFETSIFKEVEGIDFEFLKTTPMAEFSMDALGFMVYDKDKVKAMLQKIEKLKEQMEEKKEELEKAEEERAKREADFLEYVKAGDDAVSKEDYEKAIGQYELALGIKEGDPDVTAKIAAAKQKIEERKKAAERDKLFSEAMASGKSAYEDSQLEQAITAYQKASDIKPEEDLPKKLIAEIKEELAKQKAVAEEFNKLVKQGDDLVAAETFDAGIEKYTAALKIKEDKAIEQKIKDAETARDAKAKEAEAAAAAEKEYQDIMAKADAAFDTEKYDEAKTQYEAAQKLKADEPKPKERLAEIEKILADRLAKEAEAKAQEEKYQKLIDEGANLFKDKSYEEAKSKYKEALKIKENDEHSLSQIDLINKAQLEAETLAKIDAEYDGYMKEGQTAFDAKNYEAAITAYSKAADVKPDESAPKDQIKAIELLMADAAKAAEAEKKYTEFMAAGKSAFDLKEWADAIDNYSKALGVKPGDEQAQKQIDAINKIIEEENAAAAEQAKFDEFVAKANESFNSKAYDDAKLNYGKALDVKEDAEIRKKLEETEALIAANQNAAEQQAKYDTAMKEALDFFSNKEYENALEKYEAAKSIKSTPEVTTRIEQTKELIAAAKAKQAEEEEYAATLASAKEYLANQEYQKALDQFKVAYKSRPEVSTKEEMDKIEIILADLEKANETKARYDKKIEEANAAFNDENWSVAKALYEEAATIDNTQTYPQERIDKIDELMQNESLAEEQRIYQKIVDKADGFRDVKSYDEAITYYKKALSFREDDPYPKEEIEKIEKIKADAAAAEAAAVKLKEDFDALITKADALFDTEDWANSATQYEAALDLIPGSKHPTDRLAELSSKLSAAEKQKKLDEEYQAFLDKADGFFDSQSYEEAIAAYNEALEVKPDEEYPKGKIKSAENFIKLAADNSEEDAYKQLLADAQRMMDNKEYSNALDLFLKAKTQNAADPLPSQRIDEINQILADQGDAAKLQKQFDDLKAEADSFFEKGNWSQAKDRYTAAYNLINTPYVADQIKKCEEAMKGETPDEVNEQYAKIIETANKKFDAKNYVKAKELYTRASSLKPGDAYPKKRLEEINRILNENNVAKSVNLKDYGKANRKTNAVDIDALMADAEQQRKFNESKKVEQTKIDAAVANQENDVVQTDLNFETKLEIVLLQENTESASTMAELKIVKAGESLVAQREESAVVESERKTYSENVVQRQTSVVENVNLAIAESDDQSDVAREEYEGDVEAIKVQVATENRLENSAHGNEIMGQKEYVDNLATDTEQNAGLADINRKNTEVHVEDFYIEQINKSNEMIWDHEDVGISTKEKTEVNLEERARLEAEMDRERIEMVADVEKVEVDRAKTETQASQNQYDVSIDQKEFTEKMKKEIEIENSTNDIPRQNMELAVEDKMLAKGNKENLDALDQTNDIYQIKEDVEDLAKEQNLVEAKAQQKREGYETEVDDIKVAESEYLMNKENATEDQGYETKEQIEAEESKKTADKIAADQAATNNSDETLNQVDDMVEENIATKDANEEAIIESEEFLEEIRNIDLKKIDDKMKNELGQQFPEGVTEEIYTVNDEDGLMLSYVVRRVVVRKGVGNVYEKVQTKYGTSSYTKNGSGISEFQWQDQTEAADLIRN
jgi:epidermal growth factor receptor substrate 15